MTTSYGDWQPGNLRLGAPELFMLLNGGKAKAREVFKLALKESAGRGVLRPATLMQGHGRRATRTPVLVATGSRPGDLPRSIKSLLEVYDSITTRVTVDGAEGVAARELARALRTRYGSKLDRWVEDEALAELVDRGLFTKEQRKRLWLFNTTSYEPTPEGKAARAQLKASIEQAKSGFPKWVSNDPARAAAFVGIAGSAVLLIPELQADLKRLKASGGDGGGLGGDGVDGAETGESADFDADVLDAFDHDFDVLDTEIDAGGPDFDGGSHGGGDGGGGSSD